MLKRLKTTQGDVFLRAESAISISPSSSGEGSVVEYGRGGFILAAGMPEAVNAALFGEATTPDRLDAVKQVMALIDRHLADDCPCTTGTQCLRAVKSAMLDIAAGVKP